MMCYSVYRAKEFEGIGPRAPFLLFDTVIFFMAMKEFLQRNFRRKIE